MAKIDIYLGFYAPAKTFVKILKRSDHGLTVCARSGTSGAWDLCYFGRLRVNLNGSFARIYWYLDQGLTKFEKINADTTTAYRTKFVRLNRLFFSLTHIVDV